MKTDHIKGLSRPAVGASEEKVLGHVIVVPFDLHWTGNDNTAGVIRVEGLYPYLNIASDGQVLIKLNGTGGLRCYVPKNHIAEFRALKPQRS